LSDDVIAERRAAFEPREPRIKTGYLHRYAKLVKNAGTGAVLA